MLPHEIAGLVKDAIQKAQAEGDLPAFKIPSFEIRPPKKAEQGDYACAVALQIGNTLKRNPFEVATTIAKHLPTADFIGGVEVVKPGFLNFRLSDDWLKSQVEAIISEGENLFQLGIGTGKRAQVEFVSA